MSGWVHAKRDHGGLLVIDLRDHYGITPCVFPAGSPAFAVGIPCVMSPVATEGMPLCATPWTLVGDHAGQP